MSGSPFENRLRKVLRERARWAAREGTDAYRIYDEDIPEYGFIVERYGDHAHIVEKERRGATGRSYATERRDEVVEAVARVLELPASAVHLKVKAPKAWGEEQYERHGAADRFLVMEHGLKFWVDLSAYIDTGLFMDHRGTRARVRAEARGKRFLNLFCYTGAFTVHAAAGGARSSVSVDLSNTYLAWAAENLAVNGLARPEHELVRSDVTRWVHQAEVEPFDLAMVDPPSFSASKKMESSFEVQRDHVELLRGTARLLAPAGVIYFSTNFRGFTLEPEQLGLRAQELTPTSLPPDIRDRRSHRCWRLTR